MSRRPLVLKFGGESLASAQLIADAARRVADHAARRSVAVVVSARRGVTDHLLRLVAEVGAATAGDDALPARPSAAADRAVAAGEVVSAALLALALARLGLDADPLDAREAGILSDGSFARAQLEGIRSDRIRYLLGRRRVPVIAGFQGWHRGRFTTLGRGGSDITAVEIAAAIGAARCEFIKDAAGLETGDPKLVPHARTVALAGHDFLREVSRAGSRLIHPSAASAAERYHLPLAITSLRERRPATRIRTTPVPGLAAVALQQERGSLHAHAPKTAERSALGSLQARLREVDPGCELMVTRDETGWRLQAFLDLDECPSAARIVRAILPESDLWPPCGGLATVSLVGPEPILDITRRILARSTACGARITRSGYTGQRSWFVVPAECGVPLLRELHAEFIEQEPAELSAEHLA